jgi:hypothetical protein
MILLSCSLLLISLAKFFRGIGMPRYIALNFVEKRLGEKHDRNPMPQG